MKCHSIFCLVALASCFFSCVTDETQVPITNRIQELPIDSASIFQQADSLHKLGNKNYLSQAYDSAIVLYKQAAILKDSIQEQSLDMSLRNIGNCYFSLGNYESALAYLKKAKAVVQDQRKKALVDESLGRVYLKKGDFEIAQTYLESALPYYREHLSLKPRKNESKLALISNLLGGSYRQLGRITESIEYYKQGLKHYQNIDNTRGIANSYNNLANAYTDQTNSEDRLMGISFYQKAINSLEKLGDSLELARVLNHVGVVYQELDQLPDASRYAERALRLRETLFGKVKHGEKSKSYDLLGDIYAKQQNYEQALNSYQTALSNAIVGFEPQNDLEGPTSLHSFRIEKASLLVYLQSKAQTLEQLYQKNKETHFLEAALATYQNIDHLVDMLRAEIQLDDSKLFWLSQVQNNYERAIASSFKLNRTETAFHFFEKSRAILLLETISAKDAAEKSKVPFDLIQEEKNIKSELEALRVSPYQTQDNFTQQNDLLDQLDSLKIIVQKLDPQYYELKYQTASPNLKRIQQALRPEQVIIEYYLGTQELFAFTITSEKLNLNHLGKVDRLVAQINALLQSTGSRTHETNPEKSFQIFHQTAYALYQRLLQAPLSHLNKEQNELIIIPNNQLGYLPFEALLTQEAALPAQYSPEHLSYLLNSFSINYHFSSALWLSELQKTSSSKNKRRQFAGFAPSFTPSNESIALRGCSAGQLAALPNNEEEVSAIERLIGGDLFLNEMATKEAFLEAASNYQIIHLATHACADNENALLHKIYFSNEQQLEAYEIQHLAIEADMVVLSACETGVGQLAQGEGIMSLSRSFAYAGCPSSTVSLWAVPDDATSKIMVYYYQFLKQQRSKSKALQQAKLQFLKNQSLEKQHPYYWAAFIHMGQDTPISTKRFWSLF